MPGVHIGKGSRLRRAIIEEGVHIPAGSEVGFESGHEVSPYTVTDAGVIVVSQKSVEVRPRIRSFVAPPFKRVRAQALKRHAESAAAAAVQAYNIEQQTHDQR
jgi:hypothetical protein